jgi:hypothetical protein
MEDADFLLTRGWFDFVEDIYPIFREMSDDDFWKLYRKRSGYDHLVQMAFANCVTYPKVPGKVTLNIIEEENDDTEVDISGPWAHHLKLIQDQAPEYEKEELIQDLDAEIESIQTVLDNYRQNKSKHDKQIINEYISSLKDLKIQKNKLVVEKKAQYDRWVEKEYSKFKTNFHN